MDKKSRHLAPYKSWKDRQGFYLAMKARRKRHKAEWEALPASVNTVKKSAQKIDVHGGEG